jgi:hypothetical protein
MTLKNLIKNRKGSLSLHSLAAVFLAGTFYCANEIEKPNSRIVDHPKEIKSIMEDIKELRELDEEKEMIRNLTYLQTQFTKEENHRSVNNLRLFERDRYLNDSGVLKSNHTYQALILEINKLSKRVSGDHGQYDNYMNGYYFPLIFGGGGLAFITFLTGCAKMTDEDTIKYKL